MSKERELTAHEMQDRNNRNASAIPTWQAMEARNQRGADEANARHVERRHENAARPTQIQRLERPIFAGKKTVSTVQAQLNQGKR